MTMIISESVHRPREYLRFSIPVLLFLYLISTVAGPYNSERLRSVFSQNGPLLPPTSTYSSSSDNPVSMLSSWPQLSSLSLRDPRFLALIQSWRTFLVCFRCCLGYTSCSYHQFWSRPDWRSTTSRSSCSLSIDHRLSISVPSANRVSLWYTFSVKFCNKSVSLQVYDYLNDIDTLTDQKICYFESFATGPNDLFLSRDQDRWVYKGLSFWSDLELDHRLN